MTRNRPPIPFRDFRDELPNPLGDPRPLATIARPPRVAFQGEPGAFSEEAVERIWGGAAEPVPMRTLDQVMDAAETGHVDYGILPIESTLVGGVNDAYDLLALHDGLFIAAETVVPIHLCIVGIPGASIAVLQSVVSHPLMLAQCAYFFDRHRHITAVPWWDTAGAARAVDEGGDLTRAAAASRRVADRFRLEVLAEGIEDRSDTQMRFVAVAPEPTAEVIGAPARTAVLCTVRDVAGGLVGALQPLATHGFSVSHFATRPTREPWQYQYFIEFEHITGDPRAADAIAAMRAASASCRLLGTYPRWEP